MARAERSRNFEALVLQACNRVGQNTIAKDIHADDATVSRLISTHLPKLCDMLVVADLKIVPASMRCFRKEDIDPLIHFAKQRMAQIESAEHLEWD